MKIEYVISTLIGLFIFGYVLDMVSGPFNLVLTSPFGFLQMAHLSKYPFTAVSIAAKTLAIFIATVLTIQTLSGPKHFLASTLFFVSAALMELYAIQQIATQAFLISLQWTLALSYAAVVLLIPCAIYLVIGTFKSAHRNLSSDSYGEGE
jgi:hypothetical protein